MNLHIYIIMTSLWGLLRESCLPFTGGITMDTKLYLKAVIFSVGLALTFGVAGLHGKVESNTDTDNLELNSDLSPIPQIEKPEQIDFTAATDPIETSQKPVHIETQTKNETPIIVSAKAGTSIERVTGATEPSLVVQEAVEEQDSLQAIPKPVTMPQKELSSRQVQENEKPVIVMASVDMKALNKTEKPMDSVSVQSSNKPVLLTQNKTAEKQDTNAVQNGRPETPVNDSQKEDIDTAIIKLSRQIKLNDSDAGLYVLRGNLYMDKHDYVQAVNDYTKAIEINPDTASYNNRGQAYVNMWEEYNYNNRRRAYADMGKNNNRYNDWGQRYTNIAEFKQTMKDDKQADKYYKKAIKDFNKSIKKSLKIFMRI